MPPWGSSMVLARRPTGILLFGEFFGVLTWTWTWRSPRPLARRWGTPLPLIVMTCHVVGSDLQRVGGIAGGLGVSPSAEALAPARRPHRRGCLGEAEVEQDMQVVSQRSNTLWWATLSAT